MSHRRPHKRGGNRRGIGIAGAAQYPWAGNSNAAAVWIADAAYIVTDTGVSSWVTQQAYTSAGVPATYTVTQGTADDQPAFEATGMGGKPCVLGDGVSDFLQSTDANLLTLFDGDDDEPCTGILLLDRITGASGDSYWGWYTTTTAGNINQFRQNSTDNSYFRFEATSGLHPGTASTGVHLLTSQYKADTSYELFKDDVSIHTATVDGAAVSGCDRFTLFCMKNGSDTPSNFANIRIRGLWFVRNNDTALIQAIEDWAMEDQGL